MGCAGCAAAGVLGAAVFRKRTEAPAALPLERPLKLAVMADIHSVHGQWSAVYCGVTVPRRQGSRAIFRRWAAAFPYDELMRHDDLGGQQVGVLDVVDGLACRLNAKLIGIDVHGRQRRVGDAGEQRVVKGYDGQIFRDAQAQLAAELFQYHRKNVIADQNAVGRSGAVSSAFRAGS